MRITVTPGKDGLWHRRKSWYCGSTREPVCRT